MHMTLTLGRREAVPQGSDVTQGLAQVQRGLPHQCASPIGFWGGASASLEVERGGISCDREERQRGDRT